MALFFESIQPRKYETEGNGRNARSPSKTKLHTFATPVIIEINICKVCDYNQESFQIKTEKFITIKIWSILVLFFKSKLIKTYLLRSKRIIQ